MKGPGCCKEVVTSPPVPAKLAWRLPGLAEHCPGRPLYVFQWEKGLLGLRMDSLGALGSGWVVLLSWCSALGFTNKQEASPLPPGWAWSLVLIAHKWGEGVAQDSPGGFLELGSGEF